ncbi:MAG: TolC family protein [Bdellovibrio sp.]
MKKLLLFQQYGSQKSHLRLSLCLTSFCCLLIFLATTQQAIAQETLTWHQSVERAAQNNSDILSAEREVQASEYTQTGALSGFLPQISASLSSTQSSSSTNSSSSTGSGTTTTSGSLGTTSGQNYSAQLTLKQNLFAGFTDLNQYEQAKENTWIAKWKLQAAKSTVSANLKQAYSNYEYAKDLVKLNQNIVKRRLENLKIVELRFESGRENKGSLLLSQAYHEQAKYDLLQAEQLEANQKSQLAVILGYSSDTSFSVTGSVPVTEPPAQNPSFEELSLETPNYLQAAAQERIKKYDNETAKGSGFIPSLDLSGSYGKNDNSFFPQDREVWNVGLTLSIPLFDGMKDWASVRATHAQWLSSGHQRQTTQRESVINLRQTFADYQISAQKVKVDTGFKQAADTRATIARNKYNNGLMTFEEWDQIESDLITRERSYLNSVKERVVAESKWELAQGKGVLP